MRSRPTSSIISRRVRPRTTRRQGFTLLEIIVTVIIVSMVLILAAGTFISTATSATRARLRAEEEEELLRVVSTLRRQLLTIATSTATSTPVIDTVGRDPHSDWLDFVTSSLQFGRGVGRVEWRILKDPGAPSYLAYREQPWVGGANLYHNPWIVMSRLVEGMDVRLYTGTSWVAGWQNETVPTQILVTLYYTDDNQTRSFTFEVSPGIGGGGTAISTSGSQGAATPAPNPTTAVPSASPVSTSTTNTPTTSTATTNTATTSTSTTNSTTTGGTP